MTVDQQVCGAIVGSNGGTATQPHTPCMLISLDLADGLCLSVCRQAYSAADINACVWISRWSMEVNPTYKAHVLYPSGTA